ncbi:hypothetical protein CIB48_g11766 [Xylaria polymorpha]|nr:hypothetical protein CIB48_g11766 [Xylaria polymorpha]
MMVMLKADKPDMGQSGLSEVGEPVQQGSTVYLHEPGMPSGCVGMQRWHATRRLMPGACGHPICKTVRGPLNGLCVTSAWYYLTYTTSSDAGVDTAAAPTHLGQAQDVPNPGVSTTPTSSVKSRAAWHPATRQQQQQQQQQHGRIYNQGTPQVSHITLRVLELIETALLAVGSTRQYDDTQKHVFCSSQYLDTDWHSCLGTRTPDFSLSWLPHPLGSQCHESTSGLVERFNLPELQAAEQLPSDGTTAGCLLEYGADSVRRTLDDWSRNLGNQLRGSVVSKID